MAGHFYPLPPTFIGGRQPYAPKLGIAQSGPPSQPTRALATFGIILASWSQAAPALPNQVRIAPLVPLAAVPDAPPRLLTTNLNVILAQWQPQYAPQQSRADIAPLIAMVTTANPPFNRDQFKVIHAAHQQSDPWTVISLTSVAPFAEAPATPDAPPLKGRVTIDSILGQWEPQEYLPPLPKGLAPLLSPAAVSDAPPIRTYALLNMIIGLNQPLPYRPQVSKPIAALLPAPVAPDSPPVMSTARLNVLLQQWEPRAWWPLPHSPAQIAPAPDAAPAPTDVNLALIIEQWRAPDLRLRQGSKFAPLIEQVVVPDAPPPVSMRNFETVMGWWEDRNNYPIPEQPHWAIQVVEVSVQIDEPPPSRTIRVRRGRP